jgi:hypothetical protein
MSKDYVLDGRPVTVVREAKDTDVGYLPNESPYNQLLVKLEDGTEKVVQRPALMHAGSEEAKLAAEQHTERDRVERERVAAELEAMTPEQRAAHDRAEKARLAAMTPEQRAAHEAAAKHHTAPRATGKKATFDGRPVTEVRAAKAGDPGFDATETGTVLIREADGTEKVVSRALLTK